MVNTILGRKLGMTQVWDENDNVVPVTVIQAGPCVIAQVKTTETDGYEAVQIGFGDIKEHKVNKPMKGHFDRAGIAPMRYLREVRVEDASQHSCGETITVESFAETKKVDVIGVSKGNDSLMAKVNEAIAAALADGSMDNFVAEANDLASGDTASLVDGEIVADEK